MRFWAEDVKWLGLQGYRPLHSRMVQQRDDVLAGSAPSEIWLVQHKPVITLGKNAKVQNLLFSKEDIEQHKGIKVVEVERGGDATYHGPSQLMVYPIGKIGNVVTFLTRFATVFIDVLQRFGINNATWQENPAGIWVGNRKIIACGLHIRKQVVMHGFALNVKKTGHWDLINPCGIKGSVPTSVEEETESGLEIEDVAMSMKEILAEKFCK